MKKIYLKPETFNVSSELKISLMVPSLDPNNPSDLPGNPGNGGQGPGGDDDEEDWGGAKGRNPFENGLW